ncbi:MAG: DEAD/DEAH box helicase, partial [Planctomycetaceae bacterium]|nr:DEAD/DEAH box helicase [Planctomycetaceae bacterium]
MSRSKKRRRASRASGPESAVFGRYGIDESKLNRILNQLMNGAVPRSIPAEYDDDDGDDDDYGVEFLDQGRGTRSVAAPSGESNETAATSEDWVDAAASIRRTFPSASRRTIGTVTDLRLRRNGTEEQVEATIRDGEREYLAAVEVDFDAKTFDVSCTCKSPRCCLHQWRLLEYFQSELVSATSRTLKELFPEEFAERQYRESLEFLQRLSLSTNGPTPDFIANTDDAPPTIRFLWEIGFYTRNGIDYLRLMPLRQQERKNGGWTKGRSLTVHTFYQADEHSLSDLDRRIRSACYRPNHFETEFVLDVGKALEILAESDRLIRNEQSCTVKYCTLEIETTETDEAIRVSSSLQQLVEQLGAEASCRTGVYQGGAFVLKEASAELFLFPCREAMAMTVCQMVTKPIVLSPDHRARINETLERVARSVPVRQSQTQDVDTVEDARQPALLLQLRNDGELNVTVCVKSRDGQLLLPGIGPVQRRCSIDDRDVLLVRNHREEIRIARNLIEQLELTLPQASQDWRTRVVGAEAIADLMTRVGAFVQTGEAAVVWHRQSATELNVLGSVSAANVHIQINRQRDWFGLNGSCRIGDTELPLTDLLAGVRGQRTAGLLEISPGKWAAISEELQQILKRLADSSHESRGKLTIDPSAAMNVRQLQDLKIQIESDRAWQKCLAKIENAQQIDPSVPDGLQCELRDYQREGFRWLCRLAEWGVGAILADDMGLG